MSRTIIIRPKKKNSKRKTIKITKLEDVKINKMGRPKGEKATKTLARKKAVKNKLWKKTEK